jgi:hypothetical protein
MSLIIVASILAMPVFNCGSVPSANIQETMIADTRGQVPDVKQWIGRKLVLQGQTPPKTGLFVLEKDILSPHAIYKLGEAGDTVFMSNRIDIVVDDKMIIVRAWTG